MEDSPQMLQIFICIFDCWNFLICEAEYEISPQMMHLQALLQCLCYWSTFARYAWKQSANPIFCIFTPFF